jgi:GAF domain-containing protein
VRRLLGQLTESGRAFREVFLNDSLRRIELAWVASILGTVPLLHEERVLGVLEVLDRPQDTRFTLAEMELLGLFANQAAIALDLGQRAWRAHEARRGDGELSVISRLAEKLEERREEGSETALRLLAELERLL